MKSTILRAVNKPNNRLLGFTFNHIGKGTPGGNAPDPGAQGGSM